MPETITKNFVEFTSIRILDPKTVTFEKTQGGFLSLRIEPDEYYPRVNLHRAFPFTKPREYISVRELDSKEIGVKSREIGVIQDMDDFSHEVVKLFDEQLNRRYFAPLIQKINSIKEEFGYYYWDVVTDAGICRFTVHGGHNIIPISDDRERLLIVDVDGNRFEIPDYTALDEKSIKKLETII